MTLHTEISVAINALPEKHRLPVSIALIAHFAELTAVMDQQIGWGYARKQPDRERFTITDLINSTAETLNGK
tara:strand:- start:253 stop:468 length:216 start_codon:yes stop_codon:yes gene_type:complete